MSLLGEIRRRNVHRVAIAYVAAGWLLIQVAETLFPVFGLSDMAIRAVVIVLAIGFVPTVILSWVFEWTPEGFRRDSKVTAPAPEARTRRFDSAIIAMLVLAVAYFAVDKFVLDPSRDAADRDAARQEGRADALVESFGDKSIVVLPFVNISSDPEQEYLGDGLAEELLKLLARVEGLRVISRTSAFSFKDAEITSAEIARRLNVGYVLEGSVRKSGNALRITAQLVDARADAQVWSETYDHSTEDIFAIQDSVAGEVARQLEAKLSPDAPKVERHDPVAYALFLQARQLLMMGEIASDEAGEMLRRALELDPGFHDAKVLLAWHHDLRADEVLGSGDTATALREKSRATILVDEVLAREQGNPGGNLWKAWNYMRDIGTAAKYVERALQTDPTYSDALNTAAVVLTRLWRAEEAIPIARYASSRDPMNTFVTWNLARAYLNAGQYREAEETFRAHIVFFPDAPRASAHIGLAMLLQGKSAEALQQFDEQVDDAALRLWGQVLALNDLGQLDEATSALAELIELDGVDGRYHWWLVGTAYAWMGSVDDALESFEKQRDADSGIFRVEADSPLYDNLRDDPRWRSLLASFELDPDFLASVEFNPKLPSAIR